jgi:hypothetical protein
MNANGKANNPRLSAFVRVLFPKSEPLRTAGAVASGMRDADKRTIAQITSAKAFFVFMNQA